MFFELLLMGKVFGEYFLVDRWVELVGKLYAASLYENRTEQFCGSVFSLYHNHSPYITLYKHSMDVHSNIYIEINLSKVPLVSKV